MRKNKYYNKKYAHFDIRKNYKDYKSYIANPQRIKSHGFYPFLKYDIKFIKYGSKDINRDKKEKKDKVRHIMYSAHIDRYIYKFYSDKLNDEYNKKAIDYKIDDVAIAYRNNKQGKSSIDFSKEVIDFISNEEKCYIIVGDFEKFFDNINHQYLKERLMDLLNCDRLPCDQFAIYKNITKHSYVPVKAIEKHLGKSRKKLNKKYIYDKLFNTQEFKEIKRRYLKKNEKDFGIPQGASISSVYANIYMMEFDRIINNYVNNLNGLYRRYCDDFIAVIPEPIDNCNIHREFILGEISNIPNLDISEDKTYEYIYENKRLSWEKEENKLLDYLGFEFDGENVKLREKSVTKFYYKLYKKINRANKRTLETNRNSLRRSLYKKHSHLGRKPNKKHIGNFITYVDKAQILFDTSPNVTNTINKQVKKHWKIINKGIIKYVEKNDKGL